MPGLQKLEYHQDSISWPCFFLYIGSILFYCSLIYIDKEICNENVTMVRWVHVARRNLTITIPLLIIKTEMVISPSSTSKQFWNRNRILIHPACLQPSDKSWWQMNGISRSVLLDQFLKLHPIIAWRENESCRKISTPIWQA